MIEFAFDGLVGPTHHYAGLSLGNLASRAHAGEPGNPRAAALQGLAKMRVVHGLSGGLQGVLPPQERPYLPLLRALGFTGTDADVLERAHRREPALLQAVSRASSMWAANAATVIPSTDTDDGRTHFVVANLVSMFHRSLEARTTERVLGRIFSDTTRFAVHPALPAHPTLGDEGAANHTRLTANGVRAHLFGYGHSSDAPEQPERFPARQARSASQAVARVSRLHDELALFWQQHPVGIDAGAFHTDVLAVGSGSVLLLHERAFLDQDRLLEALRTRLGDGLRVVVATGDELPLGNAVNAYPFNSELVQSRDGRLALLAPSESEQDRSCLSYLERVIAEVPEITELRFVDVNASMRNGGGPACLRLRVPLTEAERDAVKTNVFFSETLDNALVQWIERHYRDRLLPDDLRDPTLLIETREALDELSVLLGLGSIYEFQKP